MSSVTNTNPRHNTTRDSSVYWIRVQKVMGSKLFYFVILLFFIDYRIAELKWVIEDVLSYITVYEPLLSGASVGPTSRVWLSTILVLEVVGMKKYEFRVACSGITPVSNLIMICPAVFKANHVDGHMDVISSECVSFMLIVQRTHKNCSYGSTLIGEILW